MTTLVAYRKPSCSVCAADLEAFQAVNAVIWDGKPPSVKARARDFRKRSVDILSVYGTEVDVRTITRHAEHVERTAREPSESSPMKRVESPVLPIDFEGVSGRIARLGMLAADMLAERIENGDELVETKDLTAVAGLGLKAVTGQKAAEQRDEANRIKSQSVGHDDPAIRAIFVFAAGAQPDVSEHEAINVTPLTEMREALRLEREASRRLASGE